MELTLEKAIEICNGQFQEEHLGQKYCSTIPISGDKKVCRFQSDKSITVKKEDHVMPCDVGLDESQKYLCNYKK